MRHTAVRTIAGWLVVTTLAVAGAAGAVDVVADDVTPQRPAPMTRTEVDREVRVLTRNVAPDPSGPAGTRPENGSEPAPATDGRGGGASGGAGDGGGATPPSGTSPGPEPQNRAGDGHDPEPPSPQPVTPGTAPPRDDADGSGTSSTTSTTGQRGFGR